MMKKYFLFLIVVLLTLANTTIVFSLLPSTSPCWVIGNVTGDGLSVDGLTIGAYSGNTLLKSSVISNGAYSLNSVGANSGDTISLRVYGHTFETFTFQAFCKTGSDPWIVQNVSIAKVANGQACSSNVICTSGNCASNVCAAQPSSGGGGSSGSGSGSGGGSSIFIPSSNATQTSGGSSSNASTVPSGSSSNTNVTPQNPSLVGNSPYTGTVSVEDVGSPIILSEQSANLLYDIGFISEDIVNQVAKSNTIFSIEVTLKKAILDSGEEKYFTEVKKFVVVDETDISEFVTIIEVIPKEVVASASLITGDFIVIKDDPIIQFMVPRSAVTNGIAVIEYVITGDVKHSVSSIETIVVYNDDMTNDGRGVSTTTERLLYGLLVLICIIFILWFVIKKYQKS